ncbi:MAG: ABC transporter substrate-binding protein, partial [Candidatus Bathyarchaeia archaeon]
MEKNKGKVMKRKSVIVLAMIALLMTPFLSVVPTSTQAQTYGPWMDYLHIKVYGNPDAEFAALDTGEIDFTDWPYTKPWIDKFAAKPDEVTLLGYSEIGTWEFDFNLQKWPTGCDGSAPHKRQRPETGAGDGKPPSSGADWDPATETWKVYFDPECPHCQAAWGFRLALNYLTDKSYIVTEILKGYGYPAVTWVPTPALAGWLDMENLTGSSFIYHGPNGDVKIDSLVFSYNKDKAKALLDAAGFTLITTGPDAGKRQDPRKPAGQALNPLIFYIRLDDPNREAAGLKLAAEMKSVGIPVDVRDVEKTVAFKSVMVEYNYHIYTGGYSFGADPTFLQGTFQSSQYWAPIGWSGGFQGFCNVEADYWIDKVFKGSTLEEVLEGVHKSTYLLNKYAVGPNLWATAGVQGYRTGWKGVVNHEGYGP